VPNSQVDYPTIGAPHGQAGACHEVAMPRT
jgi:hypothetical protein